MVKRYDVDSDEQDGPCSLWEKEDAQGPYVRFEDYQELEAENARLRQQRDAANAQFDFILENLNNESK